MIRDRTFSPESRTFRDEQTGAQIRQVTSHPSIHHPPFYTIPCLDDAMRRLLFVSDRTGRPEIFAEIRATGDLVRLTEHEGLSEWSLHPSHDGGFVYFTSPTGAWRVDTETFEEERVLAVTAPPSAESQGAVAVPDRPALSHDDRYCAVPVRAGNRWQLHVVDTDTGRSEVVAEQDRPIGQPEFHPADNALLRFAGDFRERIWVINRDGSGKRLAYRRKPYGDGKHFEWIVHETWNPCAREIITASWPRGCIGINVDTGAVRTVCAFNAWHPAINRQGTLMCADTTFPDIGLQLFDPTDSIGAPRTLCLSKSSNVGPHWDTPYCPYDDEDYQQGERRPRALQHTHPHPCFAPDGAKVVFTSDRSGHAQVYEVDIEDSAHGL